MKETPREFMPALDEGSFLLMPIALPHAGTEVIQSSLRLLDMAVYSIPEVRGVLGKAGRVESAIDPAPLSMFENVIMYKPEYVVDKLEKHLHKYLIEDKNGKYFRQWRDHIKTTDDIWKEIEKVSKLPWITPSPKLQPIQTRIIMLQTGMRSPIGIKEKEFQKLPYTLNAL